MFGLSWCEQSLIAKRVRYHGLIIYKQLGAHPQQNWTQQKSLADTSPTTPSEAKLKAIIHYAPPVHNTSLSYTAEAESKMFHFLRKMDVGRQITVSTNSGSRWLKERS